MECHPNEGCPVSNDNIESSDAERTQYLDGSSSSANEPTAVVSNGSSPFARPSAAASEPTVALSTQEAEQARQREAEAAARRESEARARAEERANREKALGTVPPPVEDDVEPAKLDKGTNDKFFGSLGLFLLRIVTAFVIGIRGIQIVTDIPGYSADLRELGVPSAGPIAWGVGIALLVAAVMFLFGFGTRIAGLVVTAWAVAMIVLFRWTDFSIFNEGQEGFAGDFELLLAAVSFLFLLIGAGGWSIDGGMRRARQKRKLYA